MAEWADWLLLGALFLFFGGLILFSIFHNPVYPGRPIADEGDAFFLAMATAWLILGMIAVAAAIPGLTTVASRMWNVVVASAISACLLWGAFAAGRRSLRLLFGTAKDLDSHHDRTWTLPALVARLVTTILRFWIGAAAVSVLCLALAIFTMTQLGNLWHLDYSHITPVFDSWELLSGVVAKLALVLIGPWLVVWALGGLRRAEPISYTIALGIAATWVAIALAWVGWLNVWRLLP